ncbi:hypothetical protein NIES2098_71100 [Calothrix sp. NIES-2098]|nr:hypothetical protein NIES2098_71100 [Calothrix sp. NIES-2098]
MFFIMTLLTVTYNDWSIKFKEKLGKTASTNLHNCICTPLAYPR